MTQAELAKVLNTTQQRIAQFEKADAVPDVFQAQMMADALDTTIDRLLHED
jgi:transcriptional regulator with XRE-family HTH domain